MLPLGITVIHKEKETNLIVQYCCLIQYPNKTHVDTIKWERHLLNDMWKRIKRFNAGCEAYWRIHDPEALDKHLASALPVHQAYGVHRQRF